MESRFLILLRRAVFPSLLALMGASQGAPYSQLIVFGDSLSDVGNVDSIFLSPYPGDGYWEGRFSNGPVYAEHLAIGLGLGPLIRSGAGGTDYAYGGAQTGGTGGLEGFFIEDVDEQVDRYLGSRTVDPEALYVVFAGANDFFNGQTNPAVPLGRLEQQFGRLANAGITQLLVPNLPLLGETPAYRDNPADRQRFNTLAASFNEGLASILDSLESAHDELSIFRLDVEGFFVEAIANPAAFGLANVSQPAAAGLEPGMWSYDEGNIVANPEDYLFWDEVHPTATGHSQLAERALDLVAQPGDFNRDGNVNAADYLVWRNSLGIEVASGTAGNANGDKRVDARDYRLWRQHFGESLPDAVPVLHMIPEPNLSCGLVWFVLVGFGRSGIVRSGRAASSWATGRLRAGCRVAMPFHRVTPRFVNFSCS